MTGSSVTGSSVSLNNLGAPMARDDSVIEGDYDYIVINDVLENSIHLLESIIRSGTAVPRRQQSRIEEIIASFGGLD